MACGTLVSNTFKPRCVVLRKANLRYILTRLQSGVMLLLNMQVETTEEKAKPRGLIRQSGRFRSKRASEAKRLQANAIDLKKIQSLAQVGCTIAEIAGVLGIDYQWFNEQKARDYDIESALHAGYNGFKMSLRSTQARLALSGDRGMLIWLGKQFLGQSDKVESKQETTVNVAIQDALKEAKSLSKDELLRIRGIIEGECIDVTKAAPSE